MKRIAFVTTLLASNFALAQDISLSGGLYRSLHNPLKEDYCDLLIEKSPNNKNMLLIQTHDSIGRSCGTAVVEKWLQEKDNVFLKKGRDYGVDYLMKTCAVVNNIKPCAPAEIFYDKNGNLKLQSGDTLESVIQLQVLSPNTISFNALLIHKRNGVTLNSHADQTEKDMFYKID